jgi:hypothetical protein
VGTVSPGAAPRLLAVMGSGETSPTMTATHRELFGRLGEQVTAVLLETPYAFQENKAEISAKAKRYFGDSVGRPVEVLRDLGAGADALAAETALARLRAARWAFAGPGSPSYALDRWRGTQVPSALAELLQRGGCTVFASAAACTIGTRTLPVYEIYKCGQPPSWLEGLDLVAAAGLRVAVIPHFDNAEGGTHDTRYCYLGERRLRQLEDQLADDTAILGVDEHTAAVLDLDAQLLTVSGRGGVTLRRRGRQWTWPSGTTVDLDELRRVGRRPPRPLPGRRRRRGRSRCAAAAGGRPRRGYTTRNANRQVATLPTRSGCPPQPRAHGKTNSPAETPRKLKHRCGFAVIDQQQRLHDRVRALGFADLGPDDPEPEGW